MPALLDLPGEEAVMHCSKCGLEIKENQAFCSGCGHPAGKPIISQPSEKVDLMKFDRTAA